MEHPEQAIKYLEKCIIFILSNGSLVDQAKLHYLYAKCLYILNKKKSNLRRLSTLLPSLSLFFICYARLDLDTSIAHMKKCVEKLESVQGSIYLLSAYSYLVSVFSLASST